MCANMRALSNVVFLVLLLNLQISQDSFACIERERLALQEFRASFTNPNERSLGSWELGIDCCQWKGIDCDAGRVIKLDLSPPCNLIEMGCNFQFGEAKHVSPSLLELEHLNHLDLSYNFFNSSPIPAFLGSMKHLTYLNLSHSDFTGRIPHQLGNLSKLVVLDLSNNESPCGYHMGGYLISSLSLAFEPCGIYDDDMGWLSKLSSLTYLVMNDVSLSKAYNLFKVFYMLPSLSHVELQHCRINNTLINHLTHGPLNSTLFLPNVEFLDLSINDFVGPIPDAFQNMTAITHLDLSLNDFSLVPQWLSKFHSLVHLDLSGNSISSIEGSILSIMRNTCSLQSLDLSGQGNVVHSSVSLGRGNLYECTRYDLEELKLSWSGISDSLPGWLGKLKNLRILDLSQNFFHGQIPESIGGLSSLVELDLSINQLNGIIPSSIGQLENLHTLGMSFNHLEGTLSEIHLKNLSSLIKFHVGSNKLDVKIDSNWTPPFKSLTELEMPSCNIGTQFPQWIQKLKNLWALNLSNNNIWGTFPNWIPKMNLELLDLSQNEMNGNFLESFRVKNSNLQMLDLSDNRMSGSIPENFGDLNPNLISLSMKGNLLEGSIPNSLCNMEQLQVLDVSGNKLSGEIPNCWKSASSLRIINLSSNKLSGTIPNSFGNMNWLQLSNNSLHGNLEQALKDIHVSEILDLGGNQFTGMITSSWINSSADLRVLRLPENFLSGNIPSSLCNLTNLRILDLAKNNLSGSIPSCVCNLTGMAGQSTHTIFEFSDSEIDIKQILKGLEQDYTKNLKYLINFDLSNNNLNGFIPDGMTCLSGLVGLNLSHNKFSGNIPSKIEEMKSLESLDLSNNMLYGSIPINMPILTSLSVLNLSNNNFSGRIPKGAQFSTFGASSYGGNTYLCGEPLSNECPGDHEITQPPTCPVYEDQSDNNEEEKEKMVFYFVIAAGYITGFWGIIGVLFLKKNWRHACFRRVEVFADTLYVEVAIRIARVKKMMKKNQQVDQ